MTSNIKLRFIDKVNKVTDGMDAAYDKETTNDRSVQDPE